MLMRTPRALISAALVAGALICAGPVLAQTTTAPATGTTTTGSTATDQAATTKPAETKPAGSKAAEAKPAALPTVPDISEGDPNAPIHVIEYGAFTCPHCAEFHADVFPQLKKNYIDTGKVRFTFRAFFLQRYGLWADMVARCGGEMRYYGLIDILFDKQNSWAYNQNPQTVVNDLRQIGLSAGLTKEQLDQCMNDGPMAQAMVAKWQKDAKKDGIDGTPTFMINGKKYSNMDYAGFEKVLNGLLAK